MACVMRHNACVVVLYESVKGWTSVLMTDFSFFPRQVGSCEMLYLDIDIDMLVSSMFLKKIPVYVCEMYQWFQCIV